jgi:predicted 3-demethylubiquinone-9 3-methyltransferase (glyoxalase superfamily)
MDKIIPFLWFDTEAEEAAKLYTSLFPDSRITDVSYYGDAGPQPAGSVMTVSFELGGQPHIALNGGPGPQHSEAFSLMVHCDDQDEVDRYWDRLTGDGGEEIACGWCRDRFGVRWQIVPTRLFELLSDPDPERSQRAMAAMLQMRCIVIADLEAAAADV